MKHVILAAALPALCLVAQPVSAQLPSIAPSLDVHSATSDFGLTGVNSNHAIILFNLSTDLRFQPAGRLVQDRNAGTARLTGRVVDAADPTLMFDVDLTFSGLTATPPAGSPRLELAASAYAAGGGPIDPSDWYYYPIMTGTMDGAGSAAGARLRLTQRGEAPQFGDGANQKSTRFGFSAWADYVVESQPTSGTVQWADGTGDLNVDLSADCVCVSASDPDAAYTTSTDDVALAVGGAFGCDTAWDLVSEAVLDVDDGAGTARMAGELVARTAPNCRVRFDLTFSNRVRPGDATYPPTGSPVVAQILPAGLFANGGSVDPAQWVYFADVSGSLIGEGDLDGALVSVSSPASAIAAQVGAGAARNADFGLYAPVRFVVDQQPTSGPVLGDDDGELWLELGNCDRPVFFPRGAAAIPSLPNVTDQCFVLRGCFLDTVTSLQLGTETITSQDFCDFGLGYFEIVDANTICFYPPLCVDAEILPCVATDADGGASDPVSLELVVPSVPTLATAPTLPVGCAQTVYVYGGDAPAPLGYCFCGSASPLESIIPGVVTLGLGANFTNFLAIDGMHGNCYEQSLGIVSTRVAGFSLYYQAIVIDLNNRTVPLPTTNVGVTSYTSN